MRIESAYFEITNLCNLNCATCYNRSGLNHVRRELSFAHLQQILQRLSSEFDCHSFAFAGGEPLLYSELPALFSYIRAHSEFQFSFVTNGIKHDPDFLTLVHTYPDRIKVQVSLDGSCETVNALTRGDGSFARTLSFINQLAVENFHPTIKMVISQNNIQDVEAFYQLALEHGGIPSFAFVSNSGNASTDWNSMQVTPRQKVQVLKLLDRLNEANPKYPTVLPHSGSVCTLSDPTQAVSALIKNDGSLSPCQLLYDDRYFAGNILTDPTEVIVQNIQNLQALAQKRLTADFGCSRCALQGSCPRGCLANALTLCGDPMGDDGDCLTRKLEFFDYGLPKERSISK